MAEYKCKIIPFAKRLLSSKGEASPLCDSCKSKDCENPIEFKEVATTNGNKKMRLYVIGRNINVVVSCEGYDGPLRLG